MYDLARVLLLLLSCCCASASLLMSGWSVRARARYAARISCVKLGFTALEKDPRSNNTIGTDRKRLYRSEFPDYFCVASIPDTALKHAALLKGGAQQTSK